MKATDRSSKKITNALNDFDGVKTSEKLFVKMRLRKSTVNAHRISIFTRHWREGFDGPWEKFGFKITPGDHYFHYDITNICILHGAAKSYTPKADGALYLF